MDKEKQPGLRIGQIFLSVAHFEHREDALSVPHNTKLEAIVELSSTAAGTEDERRGIITLGVKTVDDKDSLYRFHVEMTALVEVDQDAPNLSVREYATNQGPAMLFPFLREAVANLTGRGRFGAIWLNPFNLQLFAQKAEGAATAPVET
jgi:preprotein translocase subunit SecB